MSQWVDRWSVESESKEGKYYTVSRAADGGFGCSCPSWIFHKRTCKHIQTVAATILNLTPTDITIVNRLRFISKMHHIKLSCENCENRSGHRWNKCNFGMVENKDLVFVLNDKKIFYVLGKCCIRYEKIKG